MTVISLNMYQAIAVAAGVRRGGGRLRFAGRFRFHWQTMLALALLPPELTVSVSVPDETCV